jgi:hypothetical protein
MRVNADLADHRILFLGYITVAVLCVCPRPTGQNHLFLQIVVTGIALRNWALVLAVIVYLAESDCSSFRPCPLLAHRVVLLRRGNWPL